MNRHKKPKMKNAFNWLRCIGEDILTRKCDALASIMNYISVHLNTFYLSIAVDFAKNGISAPRLTKEYRPSSYPHFMGKKDKPMRQSSTILGQLFDDLKDYEVDFKINPSEEISAAQSFPYRSFIITGSEDYKQEAQVTKNEYDRELKRIMRQYGIPHEAELVSGYLSKFNSKQYQNEAKLFDLRNEISHAYKVVRDK
jgi:hypothetical protein